MTEATTRTLRTPAEYAAQPTDFFPPQATGPAYMSPTETPPPPAYDTTNLEQNLEQSGRKRNAWLMSAVVTTLICALIAFGIFFFIKSRSSTTQPSTTVPEPPTVTVPGIPPPPAPPKPPTTRAGTSSISSELIYPGAKTTLEMEDAESGAMLQLQSKDAYEKVRDWYIEKLKPQNIKRLPGPMTVLNTDKLVVIINGGNGDTSIILKQHDETDMDMDMDR